MAKTESHKRGGVIGSPVDLDEPPIEIGENQLPSKDLSRDQVRTFIQRLRKNALSGIEKIIGDMTTQPGYERSREIKDRDKKLGILRSVETAEYNKKETTDRLLRAGDMLRRICEDSSSILTNASLATKVLGEEGMSQYQLLNQGVLGILNDRKSYVHQLLSELGSDPGNATRIFSDFVLLAKSRSGRKIREIMERVVGGKGITTERMELEQAAACGILKLFYALWRTQNDQYIRVIRGFERHLTKEGSQVDILHYSFSDKDLDDLCHKNPPGEKTKLRKFYVALSQLVHRLKNIAEDFKELTGVPLEMTSRLKTMESIISKLLSKQEAEPYEIDDIVGAAFTVPPEHIVTLYRLLKEYHLVEAMNTYGRQSRVEITKMMDLKQLTGSIINNLRIRFRDPKKINGNMVLTETRDFLRDLGYREEEITGYIEGTSKAKTTKLGVKSVNEDVGLTHFKTFFRAEVGVDDKEQAWINSTPSHKLNHYQSYDLDKVEIRIRTPDSKRMEELTREEFEKQRTLESLQRLFSI